MTECVDVNSIKPFTIIILGIYIQEWMVNFSTTAAKKIYSKISTNKNTDDQKPKSTSDEKKSSKSISLIEVLKVAVALWQFISVIMITVLDIIAFLEYLQNNPDSTGWNNYRCLISLCVNSANYKRVWIMSVLPKIIEEEESKKEEPKEGESDHEKQRKVTVVADDNTENDDSKTHNNIATKIIRIIYIVYFVIAILWYCMFGFCSFATHFIPSCYVYIWIILCVGIFVIGMVCIRYFFQERGECGLCCNGYGWKLIGIGKLDGFADEEGSIFFLRPFFASNMILLLIVMISTMDNLYDGKGYIDSFVAVMTERTITGYMNQMQNSFVSKYRFAATIF